MAMSEADSWGKMLKLTLWARAIQINSNISNNHFSYYEFISNLSLIPIRNFFNLIAAVSYTQSLFTMKFSAYKRSFSAMEICYIVNLLCPASFTIY